MKADTIGNLGSILLLWKAGTFIQLSLSPPSDVITGPLILPHFWAAFAFRLRCAQLQRRPWRMKETAVLPVLGAGSLSLPFLEVPTMAMAEIRAGLRGYDREHQECLLPTTIPKVD